VDAHALEVLEYPLMRERLADVTAFAGGRALAEALVPSPDPAEVARRQALTTEAAELLDAGAEPRLGGARDVRDAAERAGRGGSIGPAALAEISNTVRAGLDARRALEAASETAPLLHRRGDAISPSLGPLADRIERCVESDGSGLRDDASPRLRTLRRELRGARGRASDRVRELAASSALRDHLQEGFVTERNGRPVLAVRSSSRGQVPGIVHDASGSGGTVFVEPFEVVELSNRMRELEADEREEVERILAELTALAGERAGDLAALVDALSGIDLALACATLSRGIGGVVVEVSDEVRLIGARHPLLDPASAVAIDLDLGRLRAVIVSGPNTGGKTVALKTLGLLALLHQSGVRPPAQVARLPVFDQVLADIGDEQSIAHSLSTFSGHLRNVTAILHAATERSLVLLDEVAAGTDPIEGSALAQALLRRLVARARLVMATTHYAELKEWASASDEVANAATGFDPRTHAPLYTVTLGRPGPSHALQIAARLGLDREVIEDARSRVAPERLRIEALLAEAAGAERDARARGQEADRLHAEAAAALTEAARREAELARRIAEVRAGAASERERARSEAEAALAGYRRELDELRGEIREARRREHERRRAPSDGADRAESERDRRLGGADARVRAAERTLQRIAPDAPVPMRRPLAVGDPVRSRELGVRGVIAAIEGSEAEVHGGGLRVRVPVARLEPDPAGQEREQEQPHSRIAAPPAGSVADELDVRGRRADEAREEVRAYVDDAYLAGRSEVLVIHGRGTGAVRAAVREELRRHPLVAGTEAQSLDGATQVKLAAGGGATG